MNLYAEYIKERQGLELIKNELGFVAYKISGEECFIAEMFVKKEYRRSHVGRDLLKEILEISLSKNCACITANIHLWDSGANNTLKAAQACGFEIVGANNQVLLISKKVTED